MGMIFILVTQLRNLTDRRVGFRVDDGYCSIPDLPPRKTRMVKLSRILRFSRERGWDWKIRILVDNQFTGIELGSWVVLKYVRVLFRNERNENGLDVLCVEAVPENCSDYFLRHKYFGCMRNIFWDDRPIEVIARSDSRLAAKLREIEAYGRHWVPNVDTNLQNRQCASPMRKVNKHQENPAEGNGESDHSTEYPAVDKNGEIKSQPNIAVVVVRQKESTSPPIMGSRRRRSVDTEDPSTDINDVCSNDEFSTSPRNIGKERKIGSHERNIDIEDFLTDTTDESSDDESSNNNRHMGEGTNTLLFQRERSFQWDHFFPLDGNDEIEVPPNVTTAAVRPEPRATPISPPPRMGSRGRRNFDPEESSTDITDESTDDDEPSTNTSHIDEESNEPCQRKSSSPFSDYFFPLDENDEIEGPPNVTAAVRQEPRAIPLSPPPRMGLKGRRSIDPEDPSTDITDESTDDDEPSTNTSHIDEESNTPFQTERILPWDYFFPLDENDEIEGPPNVTAAVRPEPRAIPLSPQPRMGSRGRRRSIDTEDSSTNITDDSTDDDEPSTNTSHIDEESNTPFQTERISPWDYFFTLDKHDEIQGKPNVTTVVQQAPRTIPLPPPSKLGSGGRRNVDTDRDSSTDSTPDILTAANKHCQRIDSFVVNKDDEIKSQPNVIQALRQEPRTVPKPPPPPEMRSRGQEPRTAPEPPPPEMRFRGQSGVDTKQSSTNESLTSSSNIVQEAYSPVESERGSHIMMQRTRRGQPMNHDPGHIDSFVHAMLLFLAFTFVWFLPTYFL